MRSFFALKLIVGTIIVFELACATSQHPLPEVADGELGESDQMGVVEDLDLRDLDDDEWDYAAMAAERQQAENARRRRVDLVSDIVPTVPKTADSDSVGTGGRVMVTGYRVQLCAVRNGSRAREVLQQAQDIFAAYSGYQVYLTYDSPYYKVRVGDCRLPYQADRILNICRVNGLDKAWVVKTRIFRDSKLYKVDDISSYLPDSTYSDK